MNEVWTWNDGWILMSIYMVSKNNGAKLSAIIGAADASNHAIPTTNELSSAFTKLKQHEVLDIENDKFIINSHYLNEIEKAYESRGGLFKTGDKGQKWLKKSKLLNMNESVILVTEEQLSTAYNEYTKK